MNKIVPEFFLRPFRKGDESSLALHANDYDVAKYLANLFPHPYTYDDACSWIELNQGKEVHHNFAIVINEDVVGGIGVIPGNDIHEKSYALGYWLGKAFWGQGIMTQACRQIVDHAFSSFEINRLWANVFSNNPASGKVLRHCGFKHEATLSKSIYKYNQFYDELIYALLRDDWANNK